MAMARSTRSIITPLNGPRAALAALPRLAQPLQEFLSTEAAGGLLLLAATAGALVWANLPSHSYGDLWGAHAGIDLNRLQIDESLRAWVNDGLMTVFFFVVGLEIKRELLRGELAGRRRAALPVAAALGGMVVPAMIYLALNAGRAGEHGWGIPMATDIAFAVGALALLGRRVPLSLKVFLLALAIVDDLGAIAVIALFYTGDISAGWLLTAVALLAGTLVLQRAGVRHLLPYAAIGVAAWLAMHQSGVHATIAGVAMGLLTPSRPYADGAALEGSAGSLVGEYQAARARGTRAGDDESRAALRALENLSRDTRSPLDRLEHTLHPWSSYLIVPLFALANAGISIDGAVVHDAVRSPVTAGVALGLVAGKPLGIVLFSWLAVRAGVAALPDGVRWPQLVGAAIVAGIGFTVSLFISGLAFSDPALADEARIGILAGSALMAVAGLAFLRSVLRDREGEQG